MTSYSGVPNSQETLTAKQSVFCLPGTSISMQVENNRMARLEQVNKLWACLNILHSKFFRQDMPDSCNNHDNTYIIHEHIQYMCMSSVRGLTNLAGQKMGSQLVTSIALTSLKLHVCKPSLTWHNGQLLLVTYIRPVNTRTVRCQYCLSVLCYCYCCCTHCKISAQLPLVNDTEIRVEPQYTTEQGRFQLLS